jgi:CRISPR type III-A-associated RAMP protein Csm4
MAIFNIYKLHFSSPLHISDQRDDGSISMKTIQSDTLYAALTSCLAKTGQEIPADGDLGFTLSSMFPYYQEKDDSSPIYFLPLPFQTRLPQLKDVSKAKTVKKIRWVDSDLYASVLQGKQFFDGTDENYANIHDSYLTARAFPVEEDFIQSDVAQRVFLESRTGQKDALPYYVDRITFQDKSGLYFMATGQVELLNKALALLAQEGIGTDRHVGFGCFDFTTDTLTIETPQEAEHQVALSILIPESEDQMQQLLSSDLVAYDFARRGGWITTYPYNTFRKNAIYAFLPGSVFCRTNNPNGVGRIVDLSPKIEAKSHIHPIWRNGKSLTLPIKLN